MLLPGGTRTCGLSVGRSSEIAALRKSRLHIEQAAFGNPCVLREPALLDGYKASSGLRC